MKVEAVLFDADGVLQHQNATLHALLTDVLSLPPEEIEARYHEVWEAESPILTGQGSFTETMSDLLVKWGRPPGHVDTFVQASKDIRTDEAIAEYGSAAAQGLGCCAASRRTR